jgi:hypothetical protein
VWGSARVRLKFKLKLVGEVCTSLEAEICRLMSVHLKVSNALEREHLSGVGLWLLLRELASKFGNDVAYR